MSNFEKQKIEMELRSFTNINFERPSDCRNLEQIRFYISELCLKIEALKDQFDYVPDTAYALLAQYNARQNSLLYKEFVSTY